jgi:hypothetical protein
VTAVIPLLPRQSRRSPPSEGQPVTPRNCYSRMARLSNRLLQQNLPTSDLQHYWSLWLPLPLLRQPCKTQPARKLSPYPLVHVHQARAQRQQRELRFKLEKLLNDAGRILPLP